VELHNHEEQNQHVEEYKPNHAGSFVFVDHEDFVVFDVVVLCVQNEPGSEISDVLRLVYSAVQATDNSLRWV